MHSRIQSSPVFRDQCFILVFSPNSHSSSAFNFRHYCSNQAQNHRENDEELDPSSKPRPSTKSIRAKSMARLINSKVWSDVLQSSLSSLSPSLSKTTVLQTLGLIKSPTKAFQFFKWVQEMGFPHDDQSYFKMLEILGKERNLNVARNFLFSIEKRSNGAVRLEDRFFNSLIRNYGQAGLFQESIKLFQKMKSMGVSPSVITFNSLFSILLRRGRTNMAKHLYEEMLSTYGVTPDTYTYNILIRGFCKNSTVDEGFQFFKEMSRFKCNPDVITYNTLVEGLCRAGKVKIAHNLVNGMSKKSKDLNPNLVTFTTLIRGYCMKKEVDKALFILKDMASQGLKPNSITYNTIIKGLCEADRLDEIKDILQGITCCGGFTPDTCTMNTLIHAHCCAGNLDEAFKVFENMTKLQLQADSATYSVLIQSFCQRGDFDKAEMMFDELYEKEILLRNVGSKPLAAAYNSIFRYLCDHGKTKKAERVFRQLMRRGTQDPPSYKTVIMGHCKEGAYDDAYQLLIWMLRRDFLPDVEIYDSLIDGFLHKDKPLLAKETLYKMLKSFYLPSTSIWHSILAKLLEKGLAHESSCVIVSMLERNIRQNIDLSTESLRLLFGCGLQDRAFEIIELLYKNGYCVKMVEVVRFLHQRGRLSEACELLLFSLEKDPNVDIDMCNAIIVGLCKSNRVSEAFRLCYEMVEKGLHKELICLDELILALEAEGKLDEASFISKRIPQEQLIRSVSKHLC